MNKNEVLINGGALNAPVVSALAAEQFLTENYYLYWWKVTHIGARPLADVIVE